jgi:hypothetical protein
VTLQIRMAKLVQQAGTIIKNTYPKKLWRSSTFDHQLCYNDSVYLNGFAQRSLHCLLSQHNVLPPNLCSYQKGKGCSNATLIDSIVQDVALEENQYYFAKIDDGAEKMFDRLYIELQITLLKLAGC